MPQSTNLNKTPYYDDYNSEKNFYKVLFKPGVTVQTRELTTLQSILQNQIEKFGSKFFNPGGVVIPGNSAYIPIYNAIQVETVYKGINVETYIGSLLGKVISGADSGTTAKIVNIVKEADSEQDATTVYVKYLSSGDDFETETFTAGEELLADFDVPVGQGFILTGEPILQIANPVGRTPFSVGSAARVEEGVFFVRGYFVDVTSQEIILDQYGTTPSYRVGLAVSEDIVTSDDDGTLNDNAQGFSNFAAPGADRFTMSLTLAKKDLEDYNDDSFIELFRVENGIIRKIKQDTTGSFITDVLARRTFDESGNYNVNPYDVTLVDSLTDRLGNSGVYFANQKTSDGGTPSEELALVNITPGKSYIKGYEVVTYDTVVDFPKPRTTKEAKSSSVVFNAGDLLRVNNVSSSPKVGLSTNAVVTLHAERLENLAAPSSGVGTIGYARVYEYEHHNTSYEGSESQFNLKLFDIQTFTNITMDSPVTGIPLGSYIKGSNSGATGYAKTITEGDTKFSLYQVAGTFVKNESLVINGISSTSTSIGTVTDYSINDVKSITDEFGFVADAVLSNSTSLVGPFNFTTYHADPASAGIATISRGNGTAFTKSIKVNDVVSYQPTGFSSAVFARVTRFNSARTEATVVGVTTVTNICTGDVGIGTYSVQNIDVVRPEIVQAENSYLYNKLAHSNVSEINLLNSSAFVKVRNTGVVKVSDTINLPSLVGTDYVYAAFDEERYIVENANGTIENLTNATFTFTAGGKEGTISGLSVVSGPCVLHSTQIKTNVSSKKKKYDRCNSLVVSGTKYETPKNAGLTYSKINGIRVDDPQISLNLPDVVEVHAVFESSGTGDPEVPWLALSDIISPTSNTSDFIVGERFICEESNATGIFLEVRGGSQIYVVYLSDIRPTISEQITFLESQFTATISEINSGDKNIIKNYTLDNGQRKNYYDYGRLDRYANAQEPTGRLKIYFDSFSFDSSDTGDIVTVNSYLPSLYGTKIPSYDNIRNTDVVDIRPRVGAYNSALERSPFDFESRNFDTAGGNASQVLASGESITFDFSYYLGRIDKLTLDREGNFNLVLGEPSETPITPQISPEVLDVADIIVAPYLYNVQSPEEVQIIITDNKRYTMSDLRDIEDRVGYLEYYTTLSLLETATESLLIEDSNGLNRFKSGFFVDNFDDTNLVDLANPLFNAKIGDGNLEAVPHNSRVDLSFVSSDDTITKSELVMTNTESTNVVRTGDTITLNYNEVEFFKQPFASRVVSVNPFDIVTWVGVLQLFPRIDTWTVWGSTIINWVRNGRRRGQWQFTGYRYTNISRMRARNIQFVATRLKPSTRFKFIFDGRTINGTDAIWPGSVCFPKLLEITNVVGSFQPGETCIAIDSAGNRTCTFRVCTPNHKDGPILNPTFKYNVNPYIPTVGISSLYGPQSTILNVDTESLQVPYATSFWGNMGTGSRIYGLSSKASARVADNRLVSDDNGTVVGSVWTGAHPFRTGTVSAKITTQKPPVGVPGEFTSEATATFTSRGTIIQPTYTVYYDPLAQTFIVDEESGITVTSVDLFFFEKDNFIPVEVQIRETVNGYPGTPDKVVPGLQKVLMPSQVNTSINASVPTTFTFDKMVRLEGGKEYALVIVSDSPNYFVWHSRMGEVEISTAQNKEIGKVIINKQPSMGVMFKAQNGSTWTPSNSDDIKFTLRRAEFTATSGTVRMFNAPQVSFVAENKLEENPIYTISTNADTLNDGRHILVNQENHGMHTPNEKVKIVGVKPDSIPTKLSVSYGATETSSISIASTIGFDVYDGSQVNVSNPGYAIISDEIIKYEKVLSGQLADISRAQFDTVSISYDSETEISKYEFNNVPLTKINTEHTVLADPKPTLNSYYVQVAAGSTFTTEKFGGGSEIYAGKDKNFSALTLNDDFINIPDRTSVNGRVRTVSQRSVDGPEIGFVDQGYQEINLGEKNVFTTLRTVGSKENEVEFLNSTTFEGQKSLTLELNLNTTDTKVSPIIDIENTYLNVETYLVNQPVGLSSYQTDSRVNTNLEDPHSFAYVTRKIELENSATSIQSFISCYRDADSDVRMMYKIYRPDVPDEDQIWELFPGYKNLDVNGNVIDTDDNDGRSDRNVPSSLEDEYREYAFSVDDLAPFTGFAIKIVATSSNQAIPPVIKQLRSIALA